MESVKNNLNKTDRYLGDPSLPTPEAEFEYTPEMVKEIKKCTKDITHFAENYFYITTLEKGKVKIDLYPAQKRILKSLVKNRFVCLLSSRQAGKALDLNTPIPSPNGWTTMGELKDNDIIYDEDGRPCKVIKAHDILHNRNCYKVTFSNGSEIIADEDHNWFTQTQYEKNKKIKGSVKTTKKILDTLYFNKTQPMHRVLKAGAFEGVYKDLPIDPYVLGLWLGDGARCGSRISVGKEDLNQICNNLTERNISYSFTLKTGGFNKGEYYDINIHKLQKPLNQLGLWNSDKKIPEEYMKCSYDQRLELLKGLMDTDGSLTNKMCTFYNTEHTLLESFKELLYTMGISKVTNITRENYCNGKKVKNISRIHFKANMYVFNLERKKQKQHINLSANTQYVYIKNIEHVSTRPVRCITVDSPNNLFLCGKIPVVSHNTTLMTAYALHTACFEKDKRILIVANKEKTATMILRRIRTAYEQLPNWLKPGVKQYGKTEIIFGNDSSIGISTTTGSAARGESCNVLIIDEMAFIPDHIMEEFWNSVIPVVSSYKGTKVFVVSTPNGAGNMFHKIYSEAERGELKEWKHERIDWWEIPGRGKLWEADMREALVNKGRSFDQEFGNCFLESGQSAVDAGIITHFRTICRSPKMTFENDCYKIWVEPKENHIYSMGVDVSEGIGQCASVAQIIDITDLTKIELVASYHNNMIDPFHFASMLNKIAHQWGKPWILIERNNQGGQVIDALKETHHYNNIIDYTPENQKYYDKLGIYSHTNAKYKGVMNMRYWMNSLKTVEIYDIATIQEIETFIKHPNGTWKKKTGDYIFDDRVMSLVWALFILETEITERYMEIVAYDEQGKPLKVESFNIEPPEYFKLDSMFMSDDAPPPAHIGTVDDIYNNDLDDLKRQGWVFPE